MKIIIQPSSKKLSTDEKMLVKTAVNEIYKGISYAPFKCEVPEIVEIKFYAT